MEKLYEPTRMDFLVSAELISHGIKSREQLNIKDLSVTFGIALRYSNINAYVSVERKRDHQYH